MSRNTEKDCMKNFGFPMNYNIKNIIQTYSIITGDEDKRNIISILSNSETFKSLQKGDRVLLYEGYTANLLEIVEELKLMEDCPPEVALITPESIRISNRARRKDVKLSNSPITILKELREQGLKNPIDMNEINEIIREVREKRKPIL